ncbi:hypothetical protein BBJ28_00024117 [Nothophytophthora sp. Chile5]|nr:hypothetical protein BBJ28_00024117 [Nothophytophthora sp. Chile5]
MSMDAAANHHPPSDNMVRAVPQLMLLAATSNPFKSALHKFAQKQKERAAAAGLGNTATSGFFSRGHGKSNAQQKPQALPGSVKQVHTGQLPPVWATSSPAPPSSSSAESEGDDVLSRSLDSVHGSTTKRGKHPQQEQALEQELQAPPAPVSSHTHARHPNSGGKGSPLATATAASTSRNASGNLRCMHFERLLEKEVVDLDQLRKLSWGGVPTEHRPTVWRLLLVRSPLDRQTLHVYALVLTILLPQGYMPSKQDRRAAILERKRQEYLELLQQYYYIADTDRGAREQTTLRQILVDIPRTNADLLDDIQDHYTFAQPGLQRMVQRMEELVHRCDADLFEHIVERENVQFVQFAFRWMNCLLMRELPLDGIVRIWDTYLCEDSGFESFHVYVCSAILMTFGETLKTLEFQDLVLFLQSLPTKDWVENEIEPLLSRAFILQTYFADSPSHLS